jgi:hydrogenase-4 component F
MLLLWLIIAPLAFAALCLGLGHDPRKSLLRRLVLVAGAATHLGLVSLTWQRPVPFGPADMLGLDPLGHLFLTFISALFLAVSIYFVGYHQQALLSQRIFLACMLALLSSLTLTCLSQHLGMLWVALETASLAATPLIYFRLGARSLEATWKFLLMNSVGIALALLGILGVALATTPVHGGLSLTVSGLVAAARGLDPVWLRAGFLLAIVGFGTKMGLAPFHSWKPDAYGEAPPPVAALLAGGMTLGAFLGILRFLQICNAAGQGAFAGMWMTVFGLLSIATAAIFVVGNNDYRRLLAYTSVEHMGVLVLGAGLGAAGSYASMLHAMHNTLNKGVLFFVSGFIWRMYHTTHINQVRGAVQRFPIAGILLLAGLCATCGLPPFGMFFGELGILLAAIAQAQWWTAALFVLTLAIVFVGVMTAVLPMAFGQPKPAAEPATEQVAAWRRSVMLVPTAALALLALALGIYQPLAVRDALQAAADTFVPPIRQRSASPSPHAAVILSVLPSPTPSTADLTLPHAQMPEGGR